MHITSLLEGKKILAVSHDAGGAEVLSSFLKETKLPFFSFLDGPAISIFKKKLDAETTFVDLGKLIEQSDVILCGSSWQSNLEFEALDLARRNSKTSICFLDHWINYRERFLRDGNEVLPDYLLLGDEVGFKLAQDLFPRLPIIFYENCYLKELESFFRTAPHYAHDTVNILYVCEPIKEHALLRYGNERHWGYIEEEAIRFFFDKINLIKGDAKKITIRPHPSEVKGKYDWIKSEYNFPIHFSIDSSLFEDISRNDVIVGCQSMALVVGLIAKKEVYSCIPPEGASCALPHSEILKFSELLKLEGHQ